MLKKCALFLVFALLIAATIFFYDDVYRWITNKEAVIAWLSHYGAYSSLLFIALQAAQVIVAPIPGEATGIIGGYLYGALSGAFYSTIGLTIGSAIAFLLAHTFGEPLVEKVIKRETLNKYDHFLEHKGLALAFVCLVIPGFPKDTLCYILGLSHIRFWPFIAVCTAGRLLGTVGLSISGAQIQQIDSGINVEMMVALGVIAVILIAAYFYRHWLMAMSHKQEKK